MPSCLDFGDNGHCFFSVSDTEFDVDNSQNPWPYPDKDGRRYYWEEVKRKSFIVPFDSMGAISAYIIKECDKDKTCEKEAKPKIEKKVFRIKQLMRQK